MSERVSSHKLKMQNLSVLFDNELRNMKVFCFSQALKKKYKTLTFKLSLIQPKHKEALLNEYFEMCKMVYRIRSMVAYTWYEYQKTNDLKMMRELYCSED